MLPAEGCGVLAPLLGDGIVGFCGSPPFGAFCDSKNFLRSSLEVVCTQELGLPSFLQSSMQLLFSSLVVIQEISRSDNFVIFGSFFWLHVFI
jgi:hypothetical protein